MNREVNIESGKAVIFSAPSGAGKTTIVHHLLHRKHNLQFSISATTRERRSIERDGKDYHYLSIDQFKQKIANDEFVEWEEVYPDNFYGTLKSELNRIWSAGSHVIFDVDVEGGVNLKKYLGDRALAIFVQPPSLEALRDRLNARDTETSESIERRLSKAVKELTYAEQFDVVLVNDNLHDAINRADELVKEFLQS
ncbi:MAG: guanylate kinase [Flavobacteriales bacterium]|nr:guanylate kinase [Flavobacteriales bacterium]